MTELIPAPVRLLQVIVFPMISLRCMVRTAAWKALQEQPL